MTATLIVLATVNKQESNALKIYSAGVTDLMKTFGGNVIQKYFVQKIIMDDEAPEVVTVIEFPEMESINNFFNCEGYNRLLASREKGFSNLQLLICDTGE
ncbi:MAG: DUF1330 domain-containing protein [Woeseiaceae bacterium]